MRATQRQSSELNDPIHPRPEHARTSHVLNILTGRVTLHPKPSKTDNITGISWIFTSNSGKAPNKTVGFPGRPSAAIFQFKTFHDLQKRWQTIKSIEAAAS